MVAGGGAIQYRKTNFQPDPERAILILTEARAAVTREHAPPVGDRIRALLPDMPLALARVADYLLHNPQAPMTLSIGELAEQAGTSPATVTRFCRMLGYSGYVELRVSSATDVGRNVSMDSWTTEIGRGFGPEDSPEDLLRLLIGGHTRTLREATSAIDLAVMTEVSRRIAVSAQVDIYGVGGSAMLAEELQGRLYRIGVRAYAWSEVHIGLTSAAIQDADTVAIGISTTGRTEEIIQMLTEAGRAGALTVAITNNPASPLAEVADRTIVTSVHEQFLQPDDLSAKHGQLLVLDLLYLLVAQENFDRSSAKLAASARRRRLAPAPPSERRRSRGSDIMTTVPTSTLAADFAAEVRTRLDTIAALAADGGLDEAIDLLTEAIQAGAVIQAFGTGHSESFAMEIAGRAGGLIPTTKIALRDLVLRGGYELDALGGSSLERSPTVAEDLWAVSTVNPGDVFVIASNSGVNGSIVGLALLAKQHGHPVIAVTSLQHTMAVAAQAPQRAAAVRRGRRGPGQPGPVRRRDHARP